MRSKSPLLALLPLATVLRGTDCAKILGVILTPSFSHQVAFRPIWRELSSRGHNVTLITTDPLGDPTLVNLTEIDVHDAMYNMWKGSGVVDAMRQCRDEPLMMFVRLRDVIRRYFEAVEADLLGHPEIRGLLVGNDSFDLVMAEPANFMAFAFAEKYRGKLILLQSFEPFAFVHSALGNAVHPVVYPHVEFARAPKTLLQRTVAALLYPVAPFLYEWFMSFNGEILRKHVDFDLPTLEGLLQRVNMVFVNANPLFEYMRPVTPSTVYFGRDSYLKPTEDLPGDLKEFLDDGEEGVVYFSLGTNALSADLSNDTKVVILEVFRELPFRFLWKYEDEALENVPTNVKISKWFPQQQILTHPNVKAFITQGGLQSIEEAVFGGVPMVGMPQFGDQMANVDRMVELGMGVKIAADDPQKEPLKTAIAEVVANSSYREKVHEFARLSSDWPIAGIEKVVWWTEYVLRHDNTEHLKGPARKVPIYEYLLLDVIATVSLVAVVLVYLCIKLAKFVLRAVVDLTSKRLASRKVREE